MLEIVRPGSPWEENLPVCQICNRQLPSVPVREKIAWGGSHQACRAELNEISYAIWEQKSGPHKVYPVSISANKIDAVTRILAFTQNETVIMLLATWFDLWLNPGEK